jgi:hypothetical protein
MCCGSREPRYWLDSLAFLMFVLMVTGRQSVSDTLVAEFRGERNEDYGGYVVRGGEASTQCRCIDELD